MKKRKPGLSDKAGILLGAQAAFHVFFGVCMNHISAPSYGKLVAMAIASLVAAVFLMVASWPYQHKMVRVWFVVLGLVAIPELVNATFRMISIMS